ncbi:MAG: GNAT family N-acetyltransferase [Butyrivibrio sp.]
MLIETKRLLIRDLEPEDEIPFIEMASDGSLNDCGFDKDCGEWMAGWITEAKDFAIRNNPCMDYLAYTITLKDKDTVIGCVGCTYYEDLQEIGITYFIGSKYRGNGYAAEAVKGYVQYYFNHYNVSKMIATIREENVSSLKVVEKAEFVLTEKRMYKDINDSKEEMYYFYELKK